MPALMIQAPDQASPALHAALYAEWQKFRDGTAPVDPEYIPPFILASWERCRESGITTEANSIVRVDALLLEQAQRSQQRSAVQRPFHHGQTVFRGARHAVQHFADRRLRARAAHPAE